MAFRTDVLLEPLLTHFQDFDTGKQVTEHVPESWGLQAEDRLHWEVAQLSGIAKIVSCDEAQDGRVPCVIEKIS